MTARRWIVTVATLLALVAAVALGRWQLDRAAQKIALQQALESRGQQPPLSNQELPRADEEAPKR